MRATVVLFALAREQAGARSVDVDLPDLATVADLKAALALACPALERLLPMIRIAIDAEYAISDDQVIPIGSELAAIPPVSGGAR